MELKKMREPFPLILSVLSIIIGIWILIPLFVGVFSLGSCVVLFICILVLLGVVQHNRLKKKKSKLLRLYRPIGILLGICLLWAAILSTCMVVSMQNSPPKSLPTIVLGSQVKGTEPSINLMGRINTAGEYLRQNPDAVCVASGGQGADELVSEASAIKKHLIAQGIEEERIFLEDQSTNTKENFENSLKILKDHGYGKEVVVVTDEYHQFRAAMLAKKQGAIPYAVPARSQWYLFSSNYTRELLAITKDMIIQ